MGHMGIRNLQELAKSKGPGDGMVPHLLPFLISRTACSGILIWKINPFCTAVVFDNNCKKSSSTISMLVSLTIEEIL